MKEHVLTVDELIAQLQLLSTEGKGGYAVSCEGFCVGVSDIDIDDIAKQISL